ncbi:MAG: glycosyltransferase family 4 protein [Balneolaceae bacterium]|nr:glycosyltransferase family 4 protein [Balneolaceae bacterium]
MKLLYVAHNHPPEKAPLENIGGMQRVSIQLLSEFEKNNRVEVEEAVLHSSWKKIGINTFLFLLKQMFRLPAAARSSGADAILFSSMVTASLSLFIRKRVDIPLVAITHGKDVTLPVGIYQWLVPKIFSRLDGVISVSRATRRACIERGLDPDKCVALGNGFNMERLRVFPDKQASREALSSTFGIDLENKYMLLTVGRQVKRKGHEWFIREVFPKLGDNMVFVLIGDGPESESIRQVADESGLGNRIYLLGKQPDEILKQSYAAADLFVMPNIPVEGDMEGFGIVLLEANMASTPAVAADLEGIRDVITDGENGFRIPPLDDRMFARKINAVLKNGLSEFSERSRNHVESKFSWDHVAAEYLDFISSVIERKNA